MAVDEKPTTRIVMVMGVSGAGKSTLASALARALDYDFVEGDDYHSRANVEKMRSGLPLTDADRASWLGSLSDVIYQKSLQRGCVLACSALRQSYRDTLRAKAPAFIVNLDLPRTELETRITSLRDHFMPVSLLDSQLSSLECPSASEEAAIRVDARLPTSMQVSLVLSTLMI